MNTHPQGYASFGRRFAALVIDVIVLTLITVPLTLAVYGAEYFTSPDAEGGLGSFLINWVLPAALTIGFWLTLAATPGKLLVGIKVVQAESGEPLTFAQEVLRYVGYAVSALPLLAGYFWMLGNARKQTWHDRLAKSVVVRSGRIAS